MAGRLQISSAARFADGKRSSRPPTAARFLVKRTTVRCYSGGGADVGDIAASLGTSSGGLCPTLCGAEL